MLIPYKAICFDCSSELNITARMRDEDGSLTVVIEPCKKCLDEAREEEE